MVEGLVLLNCNTTVRSVEPSNSWKAIRTKVKVTPTTNYCEVKDIRFLNYKINIS